MLGGLYQSRMKTLLQWVLIYSLSRRKAYKRCPRLRKWWPQWKYTGSVYHHAQISIWICGPLWRMLSEKNLLGLRCRWMFFFCFIMIFNRTYFSAVTEKTLSDAYLTLSCIMLKMAKYTLKIMRCSHCKDVWLFFTICMKG